MSVWIAGAISQHAEFHDDDDTEIFDDLENELSQLAGKHGVHIGRECLNGDYGTYGFVITNKRLSSKPIYQSNVFDAEKLSLNILPDEKFEQKAVAFIKELNETEKFSNFHDLPWSEVKARYYTHS